MRIQRRTGKGSTSFSIAVILSSTKAADQQVAAADRQVAGLIVAGLGYMAYQFLSGMPFHPAVDDAPSVMPLRRSSKNGGKDEIH
jgi:hypothetical protein